MTLLIVLSVSTEQTRQQLFCTKTHVVVCIKILNFSEKCYEIHVVLSSNQTMNIQQTRAFGSVYPTITVSSNNCVGTVLMYISKKYMYPSLYSSTCDNTLVLLTPPVHDQIKTQKTAIAQ